MDNSVKVKVIAAGSAEELEKMVNEFLGQENIVLVELKFAMDGTELSYNVLILYKIAG